MKNKDVRIIYGTEIHRGIAFHKQNIIDFLNDVRLIVAEID